MVEQIKNQRFPHQPMAGQRMVFQRIIGEVVQFPPSGFDGEMENQLVGKLDHAVARVVFNVDAPCDQPSVFRKGEEIFPPGEIPIGEFQIEQPAQGPDQVGSDDGLSEDMRSDARDLHQQWDAQTCLVEDMAVSDLPVLTDGLSMIGNEDFDGVVLQVIFFQNLEYFSCRPIPVVEIFIV